MRQKRSDRVTETRGKLIEAGRSAFSEKGYANTATEDLTAAAGLTRGALYHHFGGKKGLLEAVIEVIDAEAAEQLKLVVARAKTPWEGFVAENVAWVEMALEPEIRRIVLLDGPAVLGDRTRWGSGSACLVSTKASIEALVQLEICKSVDAEATAYLINGAALNAALWIAGAEHPKNAAVEAIRSFRILLDGLRIT